MWLVAFPSLTEHQSGKREKVKASFRERERESERERETYSGMGDDSSDSWFQSVSLSISIWICVYICICVYVCAYLIFRFIYICIFFFLFFFGVGENVWFLVYQICVVCDCRRHFGSWICIFCAFWFSRYEKWII